DEKEITSEARIKKLEAAYLTLARGGSDASIKAIKDYFAAANNGIRWVEQARRNAEPGQLKALLEFAARAFRHPLTQADREDLLGFYHAARMRSGLDHATALREAIVVVLMSPEFSYRIELGGTGGDIQPLSDFDLASRLGYFLWSSMPDQELLRHAAA